MHFGSAANSPNPLQETNIFPLPLARSHIPTAHYTNTFHSNASPWGHVGGALSREYQQLVPDISDGFFQTPYPATAVQLEMPKRSGSEGSNGAPPPKTFKAEHPEEFSKAVKQKLASSSRTGQACDRCKVRKIRCDGLPGGCSPCLQNNTECRTTDRITGRATSRGYVNTIEQQNRDLQYRVYELEQQLQQSGVKAKTTSANGYDYQSVIQHGYQQPLSEWSPADPVFSSPDGTSLTPSQQHQESSLFRALPNFRAGCMGDNYLGVSPGNSHLSSIKGTALSILGMEIDIADFESSDMDEPDATNSGPSLYNKSYQAFLMSSLNINPKIEKVDLPDRQDGLTYAQWYFRVLNPYFPLLHQPTFMRLLTRMYDDPLFRPTVAETVMVHMVFAIMFFQYGVRNMEDKVQQANTNNQSNMHYHFSLSHFYQLACSHTVQDVQALTLICSHLRNFPKPGASWILTQTTMSLAIELGLHRSAKRWALNNMPSILEIEMRKRCFWCLLAIHVTLSGKLGRPMSLRLEDFDVEMPESMDDELLSENGLDTTRPGKCLHNIGLQAFKIIPIFLELFTTVYAVRRQPETYMSTVNRLEAKMQAWKDSLPAELVQGDLGHSEQEGRVFALYAQIWELEFRLLLRHPSVSMTTDETFNAESMRICAESSRQMLAVVRQLRNFKSLDTTWYNSAVYTMAITMTLFVQWEKRNSLTRVELAALREEMDSWLDIMGTVGELLGSGRRLQEAVRVVTDGTLGLLSRGLPNPPVYAPQNVNQEDIKPQMPQTPSKPTNGFSNPSPTYSYTNGATTNGDNSTSYLPSDNQLTHRQTPYPAATQFTSYNEQPSNTDIAYTPQDPHPHPHTHSPYSAYPSSADPVAAPLLAAFASQVSSSPWRPQSHASNHNNVHVNSGSQAWQQWTSAMTGTVEQQDCYSANALMQLGGRGDLGNGLNGNGDGGPQTTGGVPMTDMNGAEVGVNVGLNGSGNEHLSGVTWPLNIFDIGQGVQGS